MNSEGFGETFSEEGQKGPTERKMAENNAGREEQPETGPEEEISSREDSTDSEGTVGEVQGTEEERIALAIECKGEFLSEELKKLLREIEVVQGLRAGALGEEIEARLRGVTEPSVEKLKEALREELDKLEERFHVRKRKDNAGRRLEDRTRGRPKRDPEADRGPRWGRTGRPRRHLRARSGQHTEGCAGTRVKRASIPRKRSDTAVQVRGRSMC